MTRQFFLRATSLLVVGGSLSFLLSGYYRTRCEMELLNALNDLTVNVLVKHNDRLNDLEAGRQRGMDTSLWRK